MVSHKDNKKKLHKSSMVVQSSCRLEVIAAHRVKKKHGATSQSEYPCCTANSVTCILRAVALLFVYFSCGRCGYSVRPIWCLRVADVAVANVVCCRYGLWPKWYRPVVFMQYKSRESTIYNWEFSVMGINIPICEWH